MKPRLREAFEREMSRARVHYDQGEYGRCLEVLERAHILGQRHYVPHVRSHAFMLRAGWRLRDPREVLGQLLRIVASAGSLVGQVPLGNTGRAHVSAIRPMPIPADLAEFFADEPTARPRGGRRDLA